MRRSRSIISLTLLLSFLLGVLFVPTAARVRAEAAFSNVQLNGDVLSWDPIPNLSGYYHVDLYHSDGSHCCGSGFRATSDDLNSELDGSQTAYNDTYTVKLTASDSSGVDYLWVGNYVYRKVELNSVSNVTFDGNTLSWNHDRSNAPGAEITYTVNIEIDEISEVKITTAQMSIPAIKFAGTGTHNYKVAIQPRATGYRSGFWSTDYFNNVTVAGSPSITGISIKDDILHWDKVEGADSYLIYAYVSAGAGFGHIVDKTVTSEYFYIYNDIRAGGIHSDQNITFTITACKNGERITYGSTFDYYFSNDEYKTFPLSVKGVRVNSRSDLAGLLPGSGTVIYYPSENKLIFIDFDMTGSPSTSTNPLFQSKEPLTVEGNAVLINNNYCFFSDADLTLAQGSNITMRSSTRGLYSQANLYLNGNLTMDTGAKNGVYASKNIIFGRTCSSASISTADTSETVGAIKTYNGTIDLGGLQILEPSGGRLNDSSNGIVNANGSEAKSVKIGLPTPTPKPTVTQAPKPTSKPTSVPTAGPTSKVTSKPTPKVTKSPAKPTSKVTSKPTAKVTAKPTAKVTSKVTAKPSAKVTSKVTKAPVKPTVKPADPKKSISSFVERIYKYVLDREPEAEGASFWTDELYSFRRTGAEVGLGFIFSDEFTSRGLSDPDYVTVLYNTFFGRSPEKEGLEFWTSALSSGSMDRMGVANGFVYSQEWADTCASYGIRSGGEIKPSNEIEPSKATLSFVERMYTTAMKRKSDEEGKAFWANELANFRFTGEQVGVMFFLSDEMNGFGLSNDEFVTRLYKTFMDRDPEEGGFNFWVGYLDDGGSREGAVLGFTRSEEFVNKCIEARILPY